MRDGIFEIHGISKRHTSYSYSYRSSYPNRPLFPSPYFQSPVCHYTLHRSPHPMFTKELPKDVHHRTALLPTSHPGSPSRLVHGSAQAPRLTAPDRSTPSQPSFLPVPVPVTAANPPKPAASHRFPPHLGSGSWHGGGPSAVNDASRGLRCRAAGGRAGPCSVADRREKRTMR